MSKAQFSPMILAIYSSKVQTAHDAMKEQDILGCKCNSAVCTRVQLFWRILAERMGTHRCLVYSSCLPKFTLYIPPCLC